MSHVDPELIREVKRYTQNDGTRESRMSIMRKLRECCKSLSSPKVMYEFDNIMVAHGRAAVSIVLAYTLIDRAWRLDGYKFEWAQEINSATMLPNATRLIVEDGLHPTRIAEYAGRFIELTTI